MGVSHLETHKFKDTFSLHVIVAKGVRKNIIYQNYTFIENFGVPQGIVSDHQCLLTYIHDSVRVLSHI